MKGIKMRELNLSSKEVNIAKATFLRVFQVIRVDRFYLLLYNIKNILN